MVLVWRGGGGPWGFESQREQMSLDHKTSKLPRVGKVYCAVLRNGPRYLNYFSEEMTKNQFIFGT